MVSSAARAISALIQSAVRQPALHVDADRGDLGDAVMAQFSQYIQPEVKPARADELTGVGHEAAEVGR